MALTVRVRDFQSIRDATVTIEGFTVVTGPNNSGKSAFIRAIQGVFTNAPSGPLLRHGASKIVVDMDFGDGNIVKWEKGPKANRYTVNGKVLDNVGRGCPEEVLALGVHPIKAADRKLWPQMADQFGGVLFLVGSPGSVMAEAIADVDRVGKLSSAMKLAEKDRRAVLSTLKVRRKDEKTAEEDLSRYDGLDAVGVLVQDTEQALRSVATLGSEVLTLGAIQTRQENVSGEIEYLSGVSEAHLPTEKSVGEILQVKMAVIDHDQLHEKHASNRHKVQTLQGVTAVQTPKKADFTEAQRLRDEMREAVRLQTQHSAANGDYEQCNSGAQVAEGLSLGDDASKRAAKAKGVLAVLGAFQTQRAGALTDISSLNSSMEDETAELQKVQDEVTEILEELGVCPTCRKPVDGHQHEEAS